jgi:hypothetical protein
MSHTDSEERPSRLQRLADFAGLVFRAMGSEMGQSSEEVIREERQEKARLAERNKNLGVTESTEGSQ